MRLEKLNYESHSLLSRIPKLHLLNNMIQSTPEFYKWQKDVYLRNIEGTPLS